MKAVNKNKVNEIVPAKSELEVLKILWKQGPSTVRFVHDTLNKEIKTVQYTSTLKLMQIMTEKEMLVRDESNMKHIYSPLLKEKRRWGLFWSDSFIPCMMVRSAVCWLLL